MRLAFAILAALAGGLVLASVPMASQQAPHGLHNDGPGGTSEALAGAQAIHGPLAGLDPGATLIVAGPVEGYSHAEAQAVRAFVEAGGRLLVADDTGSGRGLLAGMDVGVFLAGVPVYTPVFAARPDEPLVATTGVVPGLPDSVRLVRPTAVLGIGDAVLESDEVSWLDEDGDGRPGLTEPRGSYAFAMHRHVGDGAVLAVGSASVFDNRGHGLRDGLLAWAGEGGRVVLVDEGHRPAVDPVGAAHVLAGAASWPWLVLPAALLITAQQTVGLRVHRVAPRRRPRIPDSISEELP